MFPIGLVAQSQEIERLREPAVDRDRLLRRLDRVARVAAAVGRERKLVQHRSGPIVDLHVGGIAFRGTVVALQCGEDVAELFEWPRCGRVEAVRGSQIAKCCPQVALVPVGFPPFEVGKHRVGTEGDRTAERLDGEARLSGGKRGLSSSNQPLVLAVARRRLVGDARRDACKEDEHGSQDRPSHGVLS